MKLHPLCLFFPWSHGEIEPTGLHTSQHRRLSVIPCFPVSISVWAHYLGTNGASLVALRDGRLGKWIYHNLSQAASLPAHVRPLGTPTAASASVSMGFALHCGAFRISSSRRSQVREVASCRPGIRRRGHTSGVAQRQNNSWTKLNCDIWHHLTSEDPWSVLGAKTRTPTSADPHGQSHLWLLDCLSGTQRHRGFNWFQ